MTCVGIRINKKKSQEKPRERAVAHAKSHAHCIATHDHMAGCLKELRNSSIHVHLKVEVRVIHQCRRRVATSWTFVMSRVSELRTSA